MTAHRFYMWIAVCFFGGWLVTHLHTTIGEITGPDVLASAAWLMACAAYIRAGK
jgi:hypothetical protein